MTITFRRLAVVAILILFAIIEAKAQQRTFYDASGRVTGRSSTDSQGSTTVYDQNGRVTGRTSTDSQGTTTVYDANGRVVGKATGRRDQR